MNEIKQSEGMEGQFARVLAHQPIGPDELKEHFSSMSNNLICYDLFTS